ncbi:MAG: hypothetical protein ACLRRA_05930 [Acutalibacteraceae bacterium]
MQKWIGKIYRRRNVKAETNQNKGLSTSQVKKDWSNMEQMS